jgi:hypothetical protein
MADMNDPTSTYGADSPPEENRPSFLHAGERILQRAENIAIKKFLFTAYLTNRRLLLFSSGKEETKVAAKEIPAETIVDANLEALDHPEPTLLLSIRTSDDEIRTMKLVFARIGTGAAADRTAEVGEWIRLLTGESDPLSLRQTAPRNPLQRASSPMSERQRAAPIFSQVDHVRSVPAAPQFTHDVPAGQEVPGTPAPQGAPSRGPGIYQGEGQVDRSTQGFISTASRHPGDRHEGAVPSDIPLFCYHCGKRIPPMANFCPYCGTKIHTGFEEDGQKHDHPEVGPGSPSAGSSQTVLKKLLRR